MSDLSLYLAVNANPYESITCSLSQPVELTPREPFPFVRVGPLTGMVVGLSQGAASYLAWNWYGQPDFLFRSAAAGLAVPILLAIGGAIFGFGYAFLLMLFANLSKRNIRSLVHLLSAAITSFFLAFTSAVYALETHKIISPFLVAFTTAGVAFLVACFSSVPHNTVSDAQQIG